jgi:hypothetical protein
VGEHVVLEVAAKPGAAYSWTCPLERPGSKSKKIARPSSKPLRPTPHWLISASAWASVPEVVGSSTTWLYTTSSAPVRSSIRSIVASTAAIVSGEKTPAKS